MGVRLRWAFFFLCLSVSGACGAQESMMQDISYPYLEKLIAVAKTNYPRVKMYNDRVLQAKTGIAKAKTGWFNALNFNYLYSPNNTTTAIVNPQLLDGYQIGVYINIGAVLVTSPTIKMARQEFDVAVDNQAEYNLNIEAAVKGRYFNYIRQLAILNVRTKNAVDIESSVEQTKYKFEKGEETLDNYNKGLTAYANAIQGKIECEGQVLIAKGDLEELLGEKLEEVK
jgi:outer membrane protein TolC